MTATPHRRRLGAIALGATAALTAGLLTATPAAAAPATGADDASTSAAPGGDYLVGATYFSGWKSGDNFHFDYKNGQDWRPDHPEREPRYGWYDDTQAVMDAQINDAAANGLDYFSFDWYPERAEVNDGGELGGLHNGMNLFRTSGERDRMSYLVNYINGSSFSISARRTPAMSQAEYEAIRDAEWDLLTTQWVELFQDPEYLKIDGKPLIEIYDVQRFTADFSTGDRPALNPHELAQVPEERAVQQAALQVLKDKAALAGFPDVLIGVGLQQPGFSGEYVNAHDYDGMYDWFSAYGWHDMKRVPDPDNNYYNLIRDNHDYVWDYYARYKNPAVDYVPLVTSGWDDVVNPQYNKWSIDKTPEAFGDYLREVKSYLDEHPQTNFADSDVRMAKIGSWNELFEGHSIVPTKAEGAAYVSQVAEVFGSDDADATVSARAQELGTALTALVDEVTVDSRYGTVARLAVRSASRLLAQHLAGGGNQAIRIGNSLMTALDRIVGDDARFAPIRSAWNAVVAASVQARVTVSADDYSVTVGQAVDLGFDAVAAGTITNAQWTLSYPDTWPAANAPATGEHPRSTITVPADVAAGVLYNVSDHFPGAGNTVGNRQQLAVDYSMTVDGVAVTGSLPLTLTIVPDLTSRVLATSADGSTTRIAVWLHNQGHSTVSGEITADTDAGVTLGEFDGMIELAPNERRETVIDASNSTVGDLTARFSFSQAGETTALGNALVTPVEVPYFTTGILDGAVRSDGLVEANNSNGRMQVGNVSRSADGTGGNTEYRIVVSFPLAPLEGHVARTVLELTEFEAGSPPALSADRLAATSSITAAAFDAPSLASAAFAIAGSPPAEGVVRRLDVTAWTLDALAAGESHLTIRIRMDQQVPGQTQYRTFRPSEFTPGSNVDAPQLKVVASPQQTVVIPTVAAGDGNVRSDAIIELANGNGRLQLGNVARANGTNTEYRTLLTFPLDELGDGEIARARLWLTEFETGGAPAVTAHLLAPTGSLVLAQYGSTATGSKPFAMPGSGTTAGTERALDVTDWVQAARAAGASHLTIRLAQDTPAAAVTTYRAFRAVEATPENLLDAPRLVVEQEG